MKKRSKIPEFASIEEEAAFWDLHDTTEFEDEFEEVEATFADSLLRRGIFVSLEEPFLSQLEQIAAKSGNKPAILARRWLLERLQQAVGN
jgi:hypothetical protein